MAIASADASTRATAIRVCVRKSVLYQRSAKGCARGYKTATLATIPAAVPGPRGPSGALATSPIDVRFHHVGKSASISYGGGRLIFECADPAYSTLSAGVYFSGTAWSGGGSNVADPVGGGPYSLTDQFILGSPYAGYPAGGRVTLGAANQLGLGVIAAAIENTSTHQTYTVNVAYRLSERGDTTYACTFFGSIVNTGAAKTVIAN